MCLTPELSHFHYLTLLFLCICEPLLGGGSPLQTKAHPGSETDQVGASAPLKVWARGQKHQWHWHWDLVSGAGADPVPALLNHNLRVSKILAGFCVPYALRHIMLEVVPRP